MKTIGMFQLMQKTFISYEFEGIFKQHIGLPEKNFSAIIYGDSGHGKTEYCVQFVKYLSQFTKVLYASKEQGVSKSSKEAFERNNMIDVVGKVILAEKFTYKELVAYLKKKNSAGAVVIDSIDYMRLTSEQYIELREMFPKKAIIIVSWSKGGEPKTQAGKDIEYMVEIKIEVERYIAYARSRYGGFEPYVIWKEKAGQDPKKNKHTQPKSPKPIDKAQHQLTLDQPTENTDTNNVIETKEITQPTINENEKETNSTVA